MRLLYVNLWHSANYLNSSPFISVGSLPPPPHQGQESRKFRSSAVDLCVEVTKKWHTQTWTIKCYLSQLSPIKPTPKWQPRISIINNMSFSERCKLLFSFKDITFTIILFQEKSLPLSILFDVSGLRHLQAEGLFSPKFFCSCLGVCEIGLVAGNNGWTQCAVWVQEQWKSSLWPVIVWRRSG